MLRYTISYIISYTTLHVTFPLYSTTDPFTA